jgi:hypothetical protein
MERDWAREKVERELGPLDAESRTWVQDNQLRNAVVKCIKAERASARRVVKGFKRDNSHLTFVESMCDELLRRLG